MTAPTHQRKATAAFFAESNVLRPIQQSNRQCLFGGVMTPPYEVVLPKTIIYCIKALDIMISF